MAQFVLNTSELNQDVLGPITFASAQATFGAIVASATVLINNEASASANLGGLTATATVAGGGFTGFAKSGPFFVQPNVQPNPLFQPKVKKVSAQAMAGLGFMVAEGFSRIDFSILEEDEEVLLLL